VGWEGWATCLPTWDRNNACCHRSWGGAAAIGVEWTVLVGVGWRVLGKFSLEVWGVGKMDQFLGRNVDCWTIDMNVQSRDMAGHRTLCKMTLQECW